MVNAIIDFDDIDVWACILLEGLEFNELYRYGYNRVGCIVACPQQQNYTTVLDSILYPNNRKRWEDILKNRFIKQDGWTIFNCTIDEYIWADWKTNARSRDVPTKEVIHEFMAYKGIKDEEIANKYFVITCKNGCYASRSRSKKPKQLYGWEVGLNLKLLGRNVNQDNMMCIKCLSEYLGIEQDDLKNRVDEFKNEGCNLF